MTLSPDFIVGFISGVGVVIVLVGALVIGAST
jgi:hypothetical protein